MDGTKVALPDEGRILKWKVKEKDKVKKGQRIAIMETLNGRKCAVLAPMNGIIQDLTTPLTSINLKNADDAFSSSRFYISKGATIASIFTSSSPSSSPSSSSSSLLSSNGRHNIDNNSNDSSDEKRNKKSKRRRRRRRSTRRGEGEGEGEGTMAITTTKGEDSDSNNNNNNNNNNDKKYTLDQVKKDLQMQLQERREYEKRNETPPPFYFNTPQLKVIDNFIGANDSSNKDKDKDKEKNKDKDKDVILTKAEKLELRTHQLYNEKKLLLVLDLDHTLIHSTKNPKAKELIDSPSSPFRDSIHEVCFTQPTSDGKEEVKRYWIKERPHLKTFLNMVRKHFKLAIYTMGVNAYATAILKVIDPTEKLFKHCMIAREIHEELCDNNDHLEKSTEQECPPEKLKQLSNLVVSCNESMVLVVDDLPHMWSTPTHVIPVPKFDFFPIHDHNDDNNNNNNNTGDVVNGDKVSMSTTEEIEWNISSLLQKNDCNILLNIGNLLQAIHHIYYYSPSFENIAQKTLNKNNKNNKNAFHDYLLRCKIFKYNDCSIIYENLKSMVFENCVVTFSDMLSKKMQSSQDHELWKLIESYGGTCTDQLNENVTHLICRTEKTEQINICQTKFSHVNVVHWTWVYQSIHALKALDVNSFHATDPPNFPITKAITLIDPLDLSNRYIARYELRENPIPLYLKDKIDMDKLSKMQVKYLNKLWDKFNSDQEEKEQYDHKKQMKEKKIETESNKNEAIVDSGRRRALRRPKKKKDNEEKSLFSSSSSSSSYGKGKSDSEDILSTKKTEKDNRYGKKEEEEKGRNNVNQDMEMKEEGAQPISSYIDKTTTIPRKRNLQEMNDNNNITINGGDGGGPLKKRRLVQSSPNDISKTNVIPSSPPPPVGDYSYPILSNNSLPQNSSVIDITNDNNNGNISAQ